MKEKEKTSFFFELSKENKKKLKIKAIEKDMTMAQVLEKQIEKLK